MTDKQIIIDKVDVSGCEYLYTDSRYNDKCCSASIGGDSLCKPSEMICVKYVEHLKEQLKRKEQECEELKRQYKELGQCSKRMKEYFEKEKETLSNRFLKLKQILAEIKEIAEGMHDLWINKTKYTDIDNLVKHLLECELNRIKYKLDEISECGVNND